MKKRILIIETHPDNGKYLAEHFTVLGYEAVWTSSAETALERCTNWAPNAIVLDLRAETVDGKSILEAIKSNPLTSAATVICTAASVKQHQIDRAKQLGAAAFVAKPYDNSMLGNLVDSLSLSSMAKTVGQAA